VIKGITLLILALSLLSAGSVFGVQGAGEWIKYDSPEGRYSVLLPGPPRLTTLEAATADGEKFPQYMATASDTTGVFSVGYFDHVPGTIFSLDKARDEMVKALKGTLVSEDSISLGASPGREFKALITAPNGIEYLLQARFYDVDKRVYVLHFITARAAVDSASAARATRYFESFKVVTTP